MNQIKILIPAIALGLFALQQQGCERVKDAKETITTAEDQATAEAEFSGAFDVSDDVNSTDGKVKKAGGTILPSGAVLSFDDSLFSDGDGIEYTVDFGPMGATAPFGLLCLDGKYRSGKIHVSISQRYAVIGCKAECIITDSNDYHTGDGTNMSKLTGTLSVERTAVNAVVVNISNGKCENTRGTTTWNSTKTITRTHDAAGPGVLGDHFEISGSGNGTNTKGTKFTVTIDLALLKKVLPGCASTFVLGKLSIKNDGAKSDIKVDYDPYNNAACDRVAKATIGTKEYIFTVK